MTKEHIIKFKANLLRELYALQMESYKASSRDLGIFHKESWQNGTETIWDYMQVLEESTIGIINSLIGKYIEKKYYKESYLDIRNKLKKVPKHYEKEILDWISFENKKTYPKFFNYVFAYHTMLIVANELLELLCDEK